MFNYIKFDLFLVSKLEGENGSSGVETQGKVDKATDSNERVEALRKKFEAVKAGEEYIGGREERLRASLVKDGDPKDKEFQQLAQEVKRLQGELTALGQTRSDLEKLFSDITTEIAKSSPERKLSPEESKKLQTMINKEFLSIPFDERLRYITNPSVKTSEISSGHIIGVEFTFTFDGVYNEELYLKTTAGQVLPKEVGEVESEGKKYSRKGMSGEFFTSNNERLIIAEGSKVNVTNLRSANDLEKLKTENLNKTELFLSQTPDANRKLVEEAISRDIDPKFANILFKELVKKTSENELSLVLEEAFTEFDRTRGYLSVGGVGPDGKYDVEFTTELLLKFNKDNWKEVAKKDLGYSDEQLKHAEDTTAQALERRERMKGLSLKENADFMTNAKTIAMKIEEIYGIPWKVTAGAAALESGWGKSGLTRQANNYFGIKSFGKGPSVTMNTREEYNGKSVTERAGFKVFENMEDSFIGYAEFLTKNRRYRQAFQYGADINPKPEYYPKGNYKGYDPERFAQEIARAGYATDSSYASKVVSAGNKFERMSSMV